MADAHTGLGQIITTPQERDAVHIAIIPVEATERLFPGQGITLVDATKARRSLPDEHDGIVDPFLTAPIFEGQRFWMWMYPGSITSLRHDWTHPALDRVERGAASTSEQWIRGWAEGYGVSYDDMIEAAKDHIRSGAYFSRGDAFEGESVPDEFWSHFEHVTGQVVPDDDRGSFFSCSC